MATKETERTNITGLDDASDREAAEYNLVESLLAASNYLEDDAEITEVEIRRKGKYLFTVHIHPIGDGEVAQARKKATTYMPNPNNRKLPPIEKDFDTTKFTSWLIYLATTEEDQEKIWGNKELMKKKNLMQPVDSVGALLTFGEKNHISDLVYEISGMDDDTIMGGTEYAKNA